MARPRRHAARPLTLVTLAAPALLAASCQSTLSRWDTDALVTTAPVSGVARAHLPRVVSPLSIAAAGEIALTRRGYTLVRDTRTTGRVYLLARAPALPEHELLARRVTLEARETRTGALVEVAVSPVGDAAEARAVLRDTLEQLRPREVSSASAPM